MRSSASEGRAYDVEIGACVSEHPDVAPNLAPALAPLACAPPGTLSRRVLRGVRGVTADVDGLTPGAPYAFRVVEADVDEGRDEDRDADSDKRDAASDRDAASVLAVSRASFFPPEPDEEEAYASEDAYASEEAYAEGGDVLAAAERATSAMAGVVEAKLLAFDAGS